VIDLDQPDTFKALDKSDMLSRVMEMDRQAEDAWRIAERLEAPDQYRHANGIVVLGMGGSAIGGDLARSLAVPHIDVPLLVSRDYDLPAFVGRETLVIASSYSGGTEETLTSVDQALAAGARVMALTTGGKLADIARQRGFPLLTFDYQAQPRAALGYSLFLILGVLVKLGYLTPEVAHLDDALHVIRRQRDEIAPQVPTVRNPAKELATDLYGKLAVVYGGGFLAEVARRWKGQFNENSKNWAFFEQFPELNHNAVMGYQFPPDLAHKLLVICLTSSRNHPRIQARQDITIQILANHGLRSTRVAGDGNSDLAHMASVIQFGDFVTYYLALLNGIDPSSIEAIDYLKAELARRP
jgi:glucose/mannose-6-phosphate isomerase